MDECNTEALAEFGVLVRENEEGVPEVVQGPPHCVSARMRRNQNQEPLYLPFVLKQHRPRQAGLFLVPRQDLRHIEPRRNVESVRYIFHCGLLSK
jgi:hypothetical protein